MWWIIISLSALFYVFIYALMKAASKADDFLGIR
jgi:hypothetical protein